MFVLPDHHFITFVLNYFICCCDSYFVLADFSLIFLRNRRVNSLSVFPVDYAMSLFLTRKTHKGVGFRTGLAGSQALRLGFGFRWEGQEKCFWLDFGGVSPKGRAERRKRRKGKKNRSLAVSLKSEALCCLVHEPFGPPRTHLLPLFAVCIALPPHLPPRRS